MAEVNLLFQPVKNYCRHTVASCALEDTVLAVAKEMSKARISSMVVCDGKNPVGILTDRDLRNKVVAQGLDPALITAAAPAASHGAMVHPRRHSCTTATSSAMANSAPNASERTSAHEAWRPGT